MSYYPLLRCVRVKICCYNSFDTGAKETQLSQLYFAAYRQEIEKAGKPDSIRLGGAGGALKYPAYIMPEITLYSDSKLITLRKIPVIRTTGNESTNYYYGNIDDMLHNVFYGPFAGSVSTVAQLS